MMKNINLKIALIGWLVIFPIAELYGGGNNERIEYDSVTGDYIVWYEHLGVIEHTIVIPPTKFLPHVTTNIELKKDIPSYTYHISNATTSEQPIDTIDIDVTSNQFTASEPPSNWKFIETNDAKNNDLIHVGLAYWGKEEVGGIMPGKTISFTISANSLPGVGAIKMRGSTPIIRYAGEGVGPELEDQLNSITQGDESYVTNYAVVPCIPLSFPLVTSKLLIDIKDHLQGLFDQQLIDAPLNSKLAGYLQAAADASLHNNTEGLMKNLGMIESAVMSYDGKRTASPSSIHITTALRKAITFNLNYIKSHLEVASGRS